MSKWGSVTFCLAVISTASGYGYHSARGYENEQFSQNQQFSGSNNVQWSKTRVTPDLRGLVQQGLGMVNYDPSNIQIQQMRKRSMDNGLQYTVGFQNPALQQNCVFKLSHCPGCVNPITPIIPSCSSPCPGNACRVDRRLRNIDTWSKVHDKHWIDRKYDENDYESHTQSQSMDDFGNYAPGGMGGMIGGMGMGGMGSMGMGGMGSMGMGGMGSMGNSGMGMGGMGMGGMGMGGGGMGYMNGFRSIKKGYYQ